jgi:hypothetical protein
VELLYVGSLDKISLSNVITIYIYKECPLLTASLIHLPDICNLDSLLFWCFLAHTCNDNEQYNEGEFCEATCSDPGNCVQQAAGCQCEQGYLRDNQHCVHRSSCGCTTDDGFYFPVCIL